MKQGMMSPILPLLLFFSIFAKIEMALAGDHATNQENVYYAISSLSFHINRLASDIFANHSVEEEQIVFDDEDVAALWESASENCYFYSTILEAQQAYYRAKDHPIEASSLYKQASKALEFVRQKLHYDLIKSYSNEKEAKERLFSLHPYMAYYPNLEENSFIDAEMRKLIEPHLIPQNHPLKPALDRIFSVPKVLANEKSFKKAGFNILFDDLCSYVVIAKHPQLPGYLEKVYLETETRLKGGRPGWLSLTYRCMGAANVRNLIKAKKIKHFAVPDKWLYLLPAYGTRPEDKPLQPVILLVTDMNLASKKECEKAWANATTEVLDELYCIISHGYASSSLTKNVPYTKDGKFAFVDTEQPNKTPKYDKARRYISKKMQPYWDKLVKTGGKPDKK